MISTLDLNIFRCNMKIPSIKFIFIFAFVFFALFCTLSISIQDEKQLMKNNTNSKSRRVDKDNAPSKKLKRKEIIPFYKIRKYRKMKGILPALGSLFQGTITDLFTGFRNFSTLIQTASNPPKETPGLAEEYPNTTLTFREFVSLTQTNYRGLRKLFNTEFIEAINDSRQNIVEFRKELKNSSRLEVDFHFGNGSRMMPAKI